MKFQSNINYMQECIEILSNAADGVYDLSRNLQTDLLSDECRADLDLLSDIQHEAVKGLSKENIEFYFKRLSNTKTCTAGLLGCFDAVYHSEVLSDNVDEVEAFYDRLTLSDRLNTICENIEAPVEQKLAEFIDYLKSLKIEDELRWKIFSALLQPRDHREHLFCLVRHVRDCLSRHETELEDIFRRRRADLEAYDQKNPIETIIIEQSAYQFSSELFSDDMIVLLYDPYSLRGLLGSHGQNRFTIGAFFPYHFFRKAAKKMEKTDVMTYGKILADGNKLEILRLLSHKKCINRELADELKLSAATISYHMSVLTDLELVHTTVSANKIIYSLNREKMEHVMDCLTDYICHLEQQ